MSDDAAGILILIIFYGGAFISMILWFWAMINILKSKFETDVIKIMWVLIILFLPLLGLFLYFFIGRKQKIKENERKN